MLPLICLVLANVSMASGLRIVEFMADNAGTLEDEDEDFPDWIELHNDGGETVSLLGYCLTDDPELPMKWPLPALELEANQRMIVFASGKNRREIEGPWHTNFSLDAKGEYLALTSPSSESLSEWDPFPPQREDIAYGESAATRPVPLIAPRVPCRWLVPFGNDTNLAWTRLDFDDSRWFQGTTGLGYDLGDDYHAWILTSLQSSMDLIATSAYIRIPFVLEDLSRVQGLLLHLRYDDGFVAYLNGTEVASARAPQRRSPNSRATSDHIPSEAMLLETFDLGVYMDLLAEGENLLAIHGLDESTTSGDFLIYPELDLIETIADPQAGYLPEPTPGTRNGASFEGFVSDVVMPEFDRFLREPVDLSFSTETSEAAIYVTLNGDPPLALPENLYTEPFEINETLSIRARAYKDGFIPSPVMTHTLVYPEELVSQRFLLQSVIRRDQAAAEAAAESSLPIIALAADNADLAGPGGLLELPFQTREIPVSIEYFSSKEPNESFHIDAGLKIHGGNARSHPKTPLRLSFRREYGRAQLNYPLFEGSPVSRFDQLILRAGGHDSWSISPDFGATSFELPYHATYMRDQFLRRTEVEMGMISPRGKYVHVIINGLYWGIFDLHERPNAAFFRDHLGGRRKDWDVIHHPDGAEDYVAIDGNGSAWATLLDEAGEGIDASEDYQDLQEQLDIDNLIDSLLIRMWSGDFDWLGPLFQNGQDVTFFTNKNWYAAGAVDADPGQPFRFFTWDGEISMGAHLLEILTGVRVPQRVTNFDLTAVSEPGTPGGLHAALRFLPDYRRRFGDRAQRLFFAGGAMTIANAQARWQAMIDTLEEAMVLESARWGGLHRFGAIFTPEDHWLPEAEWVRDSFIPDRHEIFLTQLRRRGLLPNVPAPELFPFGGSLDEKPSITLSTDEGEIYFTTDGTDPATGPDFVRTTLFASGQLTNYLVPTPANGGNALGEAWTALAEPPDFDQWQTGPVSLGYETDDDGAFVDAIMTSVRIEMNRVNTSIFMRIPFEVDAVSIDRLSALVLRMKYDDGFVAYLNGVEIASAGAPDPVRWDSSAVIRRTDEESLVFQDFGVANAKELLQPGTNVIAIHGLNGNLVSSDFLIAPRLDAILLEAPDTPHAGATRFDNPIALSESATLKARVLSESGEWSPLTEASFYEGSMPRAENFAITEIHYHPLGRQDDAEPADAMSSDFEFIEITNRGSHPIQLGGLKISEGVTFTFPDRMLASGDIGLIVNNKEAFLARYGATLESRILGEFEEGTRLSNGGERLTIANGESEMLVSVAYSDREPWPEGADGGGFSLILRDPNSTSGLSDPRAWVLSPEVGGSPGKTDASDLAGYAAWRAVHFEETDPRGGPDEDPDTDGHANLLEYALLGDPLQSDALAPMNIMRSSDGRLRIQLERRAALDLAFSLETSTALSGWGTLALQPETTLVEIDHERAVYQIDEQPDDVRAFRVRVTIK